jgi:hypothetical protein
MRSPPLRFSIMQNEYDYSPRTKSDLRPDPPILLSFRAFRSRTAVRTSEESALELFPPAPEPLTIHAVADPTRKRRGEAAFLARATALNFGVLIPWGDSEPYDSVIRFSRDLLRIQVKSATRYADGRYRVKTTGANGQVYTIEEIDFFVGYVVPENIWYIIPVEALGQRKGVRFYPRTRRPLRVMSEKYREAWCLLACERKARGWNDVPTICRSREVSVQCAVCPLRT